MYLYLIWFFSCFFGDVISHINIITSMMLLLLLLDGLWDLKVGVFNHQTKAPDEKK